MDVKRLAKKLDSLRYKDPEQSATRALEALRRCDFEEDVLRLLGVYGSAMRKLSRHSDAKAALRFGLKLADEIGCQEMIADLRHRHSYLTAAMGQFSHALIESREAASIFLALGDMGAVGTALHSQGMFLFYLEDFEKAKIFFDSSLKHLTALHKRQRTSALNNLGFCCWRLGQHQDARRYTNQALPLLDPREPLLVAKALLLLANLAADSEDFDEAADAAGQACELLSDHAPLDFATASIAWVSLLERSGRTSQAKGAAMAMAELIGPLKKEKIAASAVMQLTRAAWRGELTQKLLAEARGKVAGLGSLADLGALRTLGQT